MLQVEASNGQESPALLIRRGFRAWIEVLMIVTA